MMSFFRRWTRHLLPVLGFFLASAAGSVQAQSASENEVKSVFLLRFAQFITWPNPGKELLICVLGKDPFGEFLDRAVAASHPPQADENFRIRRLSSPDGLDDCRILFLSASERDRVEEILQRLEQTPALTVSDMEKFVDKGGMIGLILIDKKVRFAINNEAINRSGLKAKAQLLQLAINIRN